ncbi:flagellar hook-basal body complex protein FliE [Wenzhouxiangella limi]|uniref:Flagellar hook-basal body complex protein FliE n=1 Tax=Wenzhouxiangella limi TaxID=2707351 RepID=A0A845V0J7_9GAMM|nr:flagellar hook-basal body complex protein FliE [Wenzhouxiangella limi]NDY97137.1 flagellar hook-basal body complex protein FliE [Wenzhouxiangella limi]
MSDMAIQQVLAQMRALQVQAGGTPEQAAPAAEQNRFSDLLHQSINKVAENQSVAGELSTSFSSGDPDTDLTSVMIAMQKSRVSFEAMVEVRNKLVEAYNEIRRMPI